jgi:drug/metabolite transporter (DMT)-like permease
MTSQVKSQIIGLLIGIFTAIGCIVYEKLVKQCSMGMILLLATLFYVPAVSYYLIFKFEEIQKDTVTIWNNNTLIWCAVLYVATWATMPLWYTITKKQGVMVGSIYEVKYIAMLAIFYIIIGENKFTMNMGIGVLFALISIYFISKG